MEELETRANTATLRYARVAPRKARVVVDLIREKYVDEALDVLRHCEKRVAKDIYKLLDSAVSNVQQSELNWDVDRLYVSEAFVNGGPIMRRFMPRAQGRAAKIRKKTSHITIALSQDQE